MFISDTQIRIIEVVVLCSLDSEVLNSSENHKYVTENDNQVTTIQSLETHMSH